MPLGGDFMTSVARCSQRWKQRSLNHHPGSAGRILGCGLGNEGLSNGICGQSVHVQAGLVHDRHQTQCLPNSRTMSQSKTSNARPFVLLKLATKGGRKGQP